MSISARLPRRLVQAARWALCVSLARGTVFDSQTVSDFLFAAETALGGGGLPAGVSFATRNALATNLNEAFDNGVRSSWANDHLVR
jgi:hypothetical protein